MKIPHFTIIRRVTVGLIDETGARIGTEERDQVYHVPGTDPARSCEDLISQLAEEDDNLAHLEPDDDEYDMALMMALDDVRGEFAVFAGEHDARPDAAPLHVEGDPGNPIHWERRSSVPA